MADVIQIRRDTAAAWASANPTLANGEQGFETDTRQTKVGDGVKTWNLLDYTAGGGGASTWIGLSDTPGSFSALQLVRANSTPDELEFVNSNILDVDKVDGCDAGVATTNVFKIPGSIARGDIFYINASGNLVRLPAGDTGKFLKTQGTTGDPVWEALPGGGDMLQATYDPNGDGIIAIAQGGSGQATAQAAIDALTQVSAATTTHVLTKDGSGHATWAAGGGGGVTAHSALTELDYAAAGHTGFSPDTHTHVLANITDVTSTVTELNFVDGVTSAIQTQLNTKAATANVMLLDGSQAMGNDLDLGDNCLQGVSNIYANNNAAWMELRGGTPTSEGPSIILYGEDYGGTNGIAFKTPNAAKTAQRLAMDIEGVVDAPLVYIYYGLDMNSKNIESSGDITSGTHNTYDLGTDANRWANVYATNIVTGDLVFEERACHICKKPFTKGEILSLITIKLSKKGTHTVPVHSSCVGGNN